MNSFFQGDGKIDFVDLKTALKGIEDDLDDDEILEMLKEAKQGQEGPVDYTGNLCINISYIYMINANEDYLLNFRIRSNIVNINSRYCESHS